MTRSSGALTRSPFRKTTCGAPRGSNGIHTISASSRMAMLTVSVAWTGAEESGGIGFQCHMPGRDGIAAGLLLLELLATERLSINKMVARLERQFGPHRYGRIDTHFPLEKRAALMEFLQKNPPARLGRSPLAQIKAYDGVKFIARDTSWLMLRGSGTEPILRIYAEAGSESLVAQLLRIGVRLTERV